MLESSGCVYWLRLFKQGGQLAILGIHFCSPYRQCTVAKYDPPVHGTTVQSRQTLHLSFCGFETSVFVSIAKFRSNCSIVCSQKQQCVFSAYLIRRISTENAIDVQIFPHVCMKQITVSVRKYKHAKPRLFAFQFF